MHRITVAVTAIILVALTVAAFAAPGRARGPSSVEQRAAPAGVSCPALRDGACPYLEQREAQGQAEPTRARDVRLIATVL